MDRCNHNPFRIAIVRESTQAVGLEDVRFNHAQHRWGANFSTVEIGKIRLKAFLIAQGAFIQDYQGYETQEIRKKYGYRKTRVKRADQFTAHCSDSLALAVEIYAGKVGAGLIRPLLEPGRFLVVDDTYRAVRRRLHDTQPAKGGIRAPYSRGTVLGLRKGLLVGLPNGGVGRLCGAINGAYRYYKSDGKRGQVKQLAWVSNHFITRC